MNILDLKSFYSTFSVRKNLFVSSMFSKKINNEYLVNQKLQSRNFKWDDKANIKVFAIFSINNWETALLDGLKMIGETYHFGWPNIKSFFSNKTEWSKHTQEINENLLNDFNDFYTEEDNVLVFIYSSDFVLRLETLLYLKRKNVLLISFCWDDLLYFNGKVRGQPVGVKQLCQHVDINLTMSPESYSFYHAVRTPVFFWKSVKIQKNYQDLQYKDSAEFYVIFIGSKYGWREYFINALRKAGINVICFGHGWENNALSFDEMVNQIKQAPATLGFSNVGYTSNITTIKGRDFEVPLFGGLYVTQSSKGLDAYYSNKELFTYTDVNDCIKKLYYIKNNPKEALGVRRAGYIKAHAYATWESRFMYLKETIDHFTKKN